jgi:RHS repeat-associated protein
MKRQGLERKTVGGLVLVALFTIVAGLIVYASAVPDPDVNHDGIVDTKDLNIIKASFGKRCGQVGFNPQADVNHDCVVNVLDLFIVTSNLGKTINKLPISNAGPDLHTLTGVTEYLDGSDSFDPEGALITFRWSLVQAPAGSVAGLSGASLSNQPFTPDLPGDYVFELVVNDGKADSLPDQMVLRAYATNAPPNARAGRNTAALVGAVVTLDGSASDNANHTPLNFLWSFVSVPQGSSRTNADIGFRDSDMPQFVPDVAGTYVLNLQVSDGNLIDNDTVQVFASSPNAAPVADAGADHRIRIGSAIRLDGSNSFDPDDGPAPLSYAWSLISRPAGSALTMASIADGATATPSFTPDVAGNYLFRLKVSDGDKSDEDNVLINVVLNQSPVAQNDTATTIRNTPVDVNVLANDGDPDGDPITLVGVTQPSNGTAAVNVSGSVRYTPNLNFVGADAFTYTISDGLGGTASATVNVTVNLPPNQAPVVDAGADQTITLPQSAALAGTSSDDGLPIPPGAVTMSWSKVSGPGTVTFGNAATLSTTASFSQSGSYVLRLTGDDGQLQASDDVQVTVNAAASGLPPDPATIAPPLNPTQITNLKDATQFLYTGPDAIQTGVAPGTIEATRAAVLRGTVMDRNGTPLSGVQISIHNHTEFGQTLSRADGMFDMAINGGGWLTVDYQKDGFLSAQRQVTVPWQDYALVPDVALIQLDPQRTQVNLNANLPMQVAQGSPITDTDGTRQATLFFPQGTTATMVMADGSSQPLNTLTVRLTEYTVGPNGPKAMPAALPPTSAYTYAVVFHVDEARAAGATDVRFAQPIPFYVENFLQFPVGIEVPLGTYDQGRAVWVPGNNGRVIKILSITGGRADLDTTGSGTVDNGTGIGVSDAERQQLAGIYGTGQSLWRVLIPHFDEPYDLNWGMTPDCDPTTQSCQPKLPEPKPLADNGKCDATEASGSIIGCETQTLGEAVTVVGTPFSLRYQSDRVPGVAAARRSLDIRLSGATIPAKLLYIRLEVLVAGRRFTQNFPAASNQHTVFTWDGRDVNNRPVQGQVPVIVRIGYVYRGVYQQVARFASSDTVAVLCPTHVCTGITGVRGRQELTIWQEFSSKLGRWTAQLNGWSLSVQHAYDPIFGVLYTGTGSVREAAEAAAVGRVVNTVAGGGPPQATIADGSPATSAFFSTLYDGVPSPDGSFFIASEVDVWRVGRDGIIHRVAGSGQYCSYLGCGIPGPATGAQIVPRSIDVAPDGTLYIMQGQQILQVRNGYISVFAGTGVSGFSGDGGPATQATFWDPQDSRVGPDGSVYIADASNHRIRRVGPDGIITTVAGSGAWGPNAGGFSGDGGPATRALLRKPSGIAVASDGSLYIADTYNNSIRRVGPDGIITSVAGSGNPSGFAGDGGPATQARLHYPFGIAVASDGSLYIADTYNYRIRCVGPEGIITTVAGSGANWGLTADGVLATRAILPLQTIVAVGPDGSLYVRGGSGWYRIWRITPPLPGRIGDDFTVAAEDGSEVYTFDSSGRHLSTLDGLTGALRYQFTYDGAGRLASIQDGDGNVTTFERDAGGNLTAIVAPFGQRTATTVNADGYLTAVTNPTGESVNLTYSAGGLLSTFSDARGSVSRFTYDSVERLIQDEDPVGGVKTLGRVETNNGYTVSVSVNTVPPRTTTYNIEHLSTGARRWTRTDAGGARTERIEGTDGTLQVTYPNGEVDTLTMGPDPRWGMMAPLVTSATRRMPSGLTQTVTRQRTATLANPSDPLRLRSQTDTITVNGRTSTSTYDGTTRTLTTTSAASRQTSSTLDAHGRVVSAQIAGLQPVTFSYDTRGRISTLTAGSGTNIRTTTLTYNAQGYVDTITDPLGRTTQYAYDQAGRPTQQILSDGQVVSATYDANDNTTSITPPGRPAHMFTFTPLNLTSAYIPPAVAAGTNQTDYIYNADRQLTQIALPTGQTVDLGYDNAGQLSAVTVPRGQIGYTRDLSKGLVTSVAAPGGLGIGYTYDGGLITSEASSGTVAGTVGRGYDSDFRGTALTVNGGNSIAFAYDADSLLTQAGALTLSRSAQNGLITGTTIGGVSDTRGYTGFGEVTDYNASFNSSNVFATHYTYDQLGRISQKTETVGGATNIFDYIYDPAGRLNEVKQNGLTASRYTYDSNGNRLSRVAGSTSAGTYDAQDRLMQYGSTTYAYTANGELERKTNSGQTTNYQYDELGNLTAVTLPNGTQIAYLIDGRNRRIGKKVNGTLAQGFLYQNGLRPIAELDGSNNVISRFVYATHVNVPDYMVKGGATYRIITDQVGSPRLVINSATGQIAQRMDYDEFGNVLFDSNPGFQPFGFAGGLYDRDTLLVRFGTRDYDAETGRWTAKDTLLFNGGDPNFYAYVLSDPINRFDSPGLQSKGITFRTARDAARHALADILQKSIDEDVEYGGLIYLNPDGTYSYTPARTDNLKHTVYPGSPSSCPRGTRLVADYHTHGDESPDYFGEGFSAKDILTAHSTKERDYPIDSFLATPSGMFQQYIWSIDVTIRPEPLIPGSGK